MFVPLSPPCPCLLLSVVIVIHSPVTDGPYALRKADHVQARRTGNPRRPSHPPWTFVSTDFNAAGTRLFPASTPPCPPRMFIPLSTNFPQFWIPTPTFHPLGSPAFRVSTFLTPRAPKCLTPSFPQDLSPSPCQAWLPLPLATSSFRPPEPLGCQLQAPWMALPSETRPLLTPHLSVSSHPISSPLMHLRQLPVSGPAPLCRGVHLQIHLGSVFVEPALTTQQA